MGCDRAAHRLEVAVEDPHQRLGVRPLAQRGEPDEVGEQDRDLEPFPACGGAGADDIFNNGRRDELVERLLEILEIARPAIQRPLEPPGLPAGEPPEPRESGRRQRGGTQPPVRE